MSQPSHISGPLNSGERHTSDVNVGIYDAVLHDAAGYQIANVIDALIDRDGEAVGTARLLAAAYNAFDSAAKKLGLNAVEMAERMQDSTIAEMITVIEQLLWQVVNGTPAENGNAAIDARAIVAKVKGDAT